MESSMEKGTSFENEVAEIYRNLDGVTKVIQNHLILGIQIDIYVEMQIQGGLSIRLAIDAKNYKKNVSAEEARKCVVDFNALKGRNSIDKGIIVSANGFTKDANAAIIESGHDAIQIKDLRIKSLDFSKYLTKWLSEFEIEKAKMLKYISLTGKKNDGTQLGKLDNYLLNWIKTNTPHITLLGNYGAGKSTTLKHVMETQVRKYLSNPEKERIPIFIELKGFRQAPNSKSLITDILVNDYGLINMNYFKFKEMNEKGRFLIILDGFDEMADKVIDGMPRDHFEELNKLVTPNSKVILSSRTHYFRDQEHVREIHDQYNDLLSHVEEKLGYEIVFINNFTKNNINSYLKEAFGNEWIQYKNIIDNTYDLNSLAEVPILLSMIVQVLPEIIKGNVKFNRAGVYKLFTEKWLQRENWRQSAHKAQRLQFCKALAFHFYMNKLSSVHWKDLPELIRKTLSIEKSADLDIFDSDVRTSNFLKRAENSGQYSFVHKSFMEYFVAVHFHDNIVTRRRNGLDELKGFSSSKVIYEFLIEMLNDSDKKLLINDLRTTEQINYSRIMSSRDKDIDEQKLYTNPESLGNCAYLLINSVRTLNNVQMDSANLYGAEINDISFNDASLRGVNFEQCILENISFRNSKLTGASFRGAHLNNVDFTNATIDNVDFRDIILTGNTFITMYLAEYWASAKLDENLRKRLEISYKKPGEIITYIGGEER